MIHQQSNDHVFTLEQLDNTYELIDSIIEGLDDQAMAELMSGYEGDIDAIMAQLVTETNNVLNFQSGKITTSSFGYLDHFTDAVEESFRVSSLTYFGQSVLPDFEMNWHHLEWGQMSQMYRLLCIIAARDHSKSFFWSKLYPLWKLYRYKKFDPLFDLTRDRSLCEFGVLFSNEISLGEELLDFVKDEIENNEILSERLFPGKSSGGWAKQSIRCKNGSRMLVKSAGSKARGLHPGWIVVDDYLNDQALYSATQRRKSIDHFHSVIMNMIVPNGQVAVVGTPFHREDLYGDLKKKEGWRVFEYPAIFPDGSLLWENRHNMRALLEKRKSQGALIFSREILVKPVTDDSAIFTKAILDRAFEGMGEYTLVHNRHSFPRNVSFKRIVTGCDFARSANVGADYSCFITLGIDQNDKMWVLNIFREKGLSYNAQINAIRKIYSNFRPDLILMEDNQMQSLFVDGAKELGLPVEGHHTGANKKNLYEGLPALAVLMEQGKIKFPCGDARSKGLTEQLAGELASIAFIEDTGKLESTDQHDDGAMALWIACRAAHNAHSGFNFSFI